MKIVKDLFLLCILCCSHVASAESSLARFVDPRIGTGDHGHVYIGANVPFGMVQAGPNQYQYQWDWCSGYHESSDSIIGFSQLHLSGTGCGDLGDIALMPMVGEVNCSRRGMVQTFKHENEEAKAGYYRVKLDNGIECEMTATKRVALHRYTFANAVAKGNVSHDQKLVIDLENAVSTWDKTTLCRFQRLDEHTIIGFRHSTGWAQAQRLFFAICLSRPIEAIEYRKASRPRSEGDQYAIVHWDEKYDSEPLLVKVALSGVSEANALMNLRAELEGWDFENTCKQAEESWEKELSRVRATFPTERESRIFYSAMFHLMVAPQLWCDVNGDYRGADDKIHYLPDFQNVTTLSFWDTYRAANPLSTLIFPDRSRDYAHTLMNIYRQTGELPVWHLMSNETYCMVGEPAVPILADLVLKNQLGDIDPEEAYEAIINSLELNGQPAWAPHDHRGKDLIGKYGYIPFDAGQNESVGKNMEYFLAFWSAAQIAGRLGHKEDSVRLAAISQNYKKLYDPRVGFIRAIDKQEKFHSMEDFNPCYQTGDYTEGNPWQYTFLVPHDVKGLIELMGGEKVFEEKLDALLKADSQLNDDANPDISGLIGQYAHGNEPSHHILYMYNYIGKPQKGQKMIRRVMDDLYDDQPTGLCGNEDVGQMSAWYIMSALGFYQVEPCGGIYQLGCPAVREASFGNFTIRTKGNPGKGVVKRWKLNGKPMKRTYITHEEIMKGGLLECVY